MFRAYRNCEQDANARFFRSGEEYTCRINYAPSASQVPALYPSFQAPQFDSQLIWRRLLELVGPQSKSGREWRTARYCRLGRGSQN
jgi:hypothetical protein